VQEAATFFKARAQIERDYGRDMLKLARTAVDQYALNDGKAGCAHFHYPTTTLQSYACTGHTSTHGTAS
jgi:hypothetical protein